MKYKSIWAAFLCTCFFASNARLRESQLEIDELENRMEIEMNEQEKEETAFVHKTVLENGMTILVKEVPTLPKVSLQVWYNVGSKDEKTGEKGDAHLIEHMIFKGTIKKTGNLPYLSESDINVITHMLSGSTNAFTSYDYTGYLFNLPVENWRESLPILADCMQNCAFKDDHLNSEMQAVIQELKMYRDNYPRTLLMDMLAAIFPDHPYHYPVIGFKQDLFDVHADRLRQFYKKHYWPNNATLVVVGDVRVEEVTLLAKKYFEKIPASKEYKKDTFFFNKDIISHDVTLYRDVQKPFACAAFAIPGAQTKNDHLMEVVSYIMGLGKGSRLYRKLVDQEQLVTSLRASPVLLFEAGLFVIQFEPKRKEDISRIYALIQKEIDAIIAEGISDIEYRRALSQARMNYYSLLEDIETQAQEIGRSFLSTGDENYAFTFVKEPKEVIEAQIKDLFARYFKSSVMHKGLILPLSQEDKQEWQRLQKASDEYDRVFLARRVRTTPIEPPHYAKSITVKDPAPFHFPKYTSFALKNGVKVLYYADQRIPKIDLILELKARPYYDSEALPGLYNFVASMLWEGTQKYSAAQLADELETRGMILKVAPGTITLSMLADDFQKGLELLEEIIVHPRFGEKEIEKVREQLLSQIKSFWDNPQQIAGLLVAEEVYKGHPYAKNILGTEESIKKITKKDLIEFHKKYFTPDGARLAIVGDIERDSFAATLEKTLGGWKGTKVSDMQFPTLKAITPHEKTYAINRDQLVLCFVGLSVARLNPDFDKLLLFDQIFSGGTLGSLHSKLFQLREQSGLFYTIGGSLVSGANEQPGIVVVKTIVSLDRLAEAEKAIKGVIEKVVDEITSEELAEAKRAVYSTMVNGFANSMGIASLFLQIDRYNFPKDYFDTRIQKLNAITIDQVKEAVKKVLLNEAMLTIKIGRIEKAQAEKPEQK